MDGKVPRIMGTMAKIVHSEAAPSEAVHYSLAGVEFDLSGKKSFETDDREVISNAQAHPWLTVIVEPVEQPDAPAEEAEENPVALDAGKTQTEAVVTEGVAETLAADDTSKTSDKTKKGS